MAGHSSGGYLATALAEQRPDLVGSLAMVSTGPSPEALLPQPALLRALSAPPFGPLVWALRSEAMIRKGVSAAAAGPVDVPADLVADVRGITYRTFSTVLLRKTAYIEERSVPKRLTALDIPVLVIFGGADPANTPRRRRMLAGRGRVRIDSLANEVGWSRKRVWSRFRSPLGVTPNEPPSWCASTMPPTSSRLVTPPHGWPRERLRRPVPPAPRDQGDGWAHTLGLAAAPWLAIDDVAWPASPT